MPNSDEYKEQREYAWKYFQLHAGQRMASFNFFVVIAALLTAGVAGTLKTDGEYEAIGFALGLSLAVISFIFWKLDERVGYLIKHAETALKAIEKTGKGEEEGTLATTMLFCAEEERTSQIQGRQGRLPWNWHLSYSDCFGAIYLIFGLLGVVGCVWAIAQWVA